jgi:DNA primase
MNRARGGIDVGQVRAAHPIVDVVAASEVELVPRGRGYMACCPFHDDATASMSVGAVEGRFHCFGCGASGDVIDYVRRLRGCGFTDAVRALGRETPPPTARRRLPQARPPARTFATPPERVMQINQLAWRHLTTREAVARAETYLREERGIDANALRGACGGAPVAGYASAGRTSLTDFLRDHGVTEQEMIDADLAHLSRRGTLIDTLLDRLVLPVRDRQSRIRGFIGRDLSGDPQAPKYRNPTRTPVFDKATLLYQPIIPEPAPDATVVIVEGALDALAIAAAAATTGQTDRFVPCTTSGVTVSAAQATQVLALHPRPPVIALDGDTAGAEGTARWITQLCLNHRRPALVTRLPDDLDPADWLHRQGPAGLSAFDRATCLTAKANDVAPRLPGREVTQACLARGDASVHAVITALVPVAVRLPTRAAEQLVATAAAEMRSHGHDPDEVFTTALTCAIEQTRRRQHHAQQEAAHVHNRYDTGPPVHNLEPAG